MIDNQTLKTFQSKHILVLGDVMLDRYLLGSVDRISPEAPVPVVSLQREENRLGGAANVALNLRALGARVTVCSVIGDDHNGRLLLQLLEENNVSTFGIVKDKTRPTTVKTRVVAGRQQLVRIDEETTTNIGIETESAVFQKLNKLIAHDLDAIIFQDYNKGLLTHSLIEKSIQLANENNILTTVDPKKQNFLAYKNVSLFKPNLKELREGLNQRIDMNQIETLTNAVDNLVQKLEVNTAFITLSEYGVFIQNQHEKYHIPAQKRDIADVSGAGDTVIAVATLALCAGLPLKDLAFLSNLAGGLVCEKPGVVCIDAQQLINEAQKFQ